MPFFSELKRRNVIRVGLAYVVAAWVLIQVMEIAVEAFEAPTWVLKLIVTMLAVGLLPALVFSWIYELTPGGLKRESDVTPEESALAHTARKLNLTVIALLLLAMAIFVGDRFMASPASAPTHRASTGEMRMQPADTTATTAPTQKETVAGAQQAAADTAPPVVAVLPFAARSMGGEEGRFLADGIHDDLLTQLAKLEIFRVVSRTSVMEYLGTTKNMRQIGEELGAGHILEGGLQQAGGRVRINAQLIDAVTDEHLWAETFERELTPDAIFEIQAEIALAIAGALKATLSEAQAAELATAPTSSQGAYEAFLQARLNTYVYDEDARELSVRQFENAVSLDPEFAEAWGWLGFARLLAAWSSGLSNLGITPEDAPLVASAREAIARARELKPGLPEADYAEAHYYYWARADYDAALGMIEPLIARFPNNGDWVASRGWFNRRAGNWTQGVADLQRALELDPRNGFVALELASFHIQLRQWEQARPALEHALAISGELETYLSHRATLEAECCGDLSTARELAERLQDTGRDAMPMVNVLRLEGRYAEALALLGKYGPGASAAGPDQNWRTAILLARQMGDATALRRDSEAYRAHLETYLAGHEAFSQVHRDLALAALALGERDTALEHYAAAGGLRRPDAVFDAFAQTDWALVFALFGEHELALEHLARSLAMPAGATWPLVRLNPVFDGLRDHPGYAALERKYQPDS